MSVVAWDSCGLHYATADIPTFWTTVGAPTKQTSSPPFPGGAYLRLASGAAASLRKAFDGGAKATVQVGVRLRIVAAPASAVAVLTLSDGSSAQVVVAINPDLTVSVRRDATVLATTPAPLSANVWTFLEIQATIGSSAGAYDLRFNETSQISGSSQNTQATGNASVTSVLFSNGAGVATIDVADFYATDDAGTLNNGFLGDGTYDFLPASGPGDLTQLTPVGAPTNWQSQDDAVPNGDTDYVSTATAGQADLYAMANLSVTPQSIRFVAAECLMRKDASGTASGAVKCRSGSTNYDGPSVALTTSYAPVVYLMEVDPATEEEWTVSGLADAQAGPTLVSL